MPETQIYHGDFNPSDIARDIISQFNRGNYQVQQIGRDPKIAVQIATRQFAQSGGQTALTITLHKVEDGVSVQVGNQAGWRGSQPRHHCPERSANPMTLLGRLDDLAQDIESLQLEEEVWQLIEGSARQHGVGKVLSERLNHYICPYCNTANEQGAGRCVACGAPLGDIQPQTCLKCGFVVRNIERECPNCGAILPSR